MKSTKLFASKSSLLAVGLLSASAALMALPASAETVQINLTDKTNSNTSNYPTVSVTLKDDPAKPGTITATVNVVPGSTGYIGDLRGVYFNIPGVSDLAITPVAGGPLTKISTNGDFSKFSNSADLQGTGLDFNAGVEVGKQGIAKGDDYQSTTFTISGTGLTLSSFSSQSIGTRLMSVGAPGSSRDLSSKTAGTAPVIVASNTPSSPSTPGGGTPEQPTGGTPDAPSGGTPDAPSGGTPDAPSGGTPDAPGGGTPDAPGGGTPDAPGGGIPDAPGGGIPDAPGGGIPDAPGGGTPDAPGGGTPAPSNSGGSAEQVPEPTTMAGSALGLAALMKWRSRRKASKNN